MRTYRVEIAMSRPFPLARRGAGTIRCRATTEGQEPPWIGRLGHSGMRALIRGGRDPRTDGHAQDGVLAAAGRQPARRAAGRTVLRQPEGDGGPDRRQLVGADRRGLRGPPCAGDSEPAPAKAGDRTEVKFPTNAQRRRGLGPVGKGNVHGLLVHAMIAVDARSGSCLGLAGGDVWSRAGVNPTPHGERPLAERESVHWVRTAQQAKLVLQSAAMGGGPRERHVPALGIGAGRERACADPGDEGPRAGRGRHAVRDGGRRAGGGQTRDQAAGTRSRTTEAHRQGRAASLRSGDPPPAAGARPEPAAQRAAASDRGARDRSARGCRGAALAAADTHNIADAKAAWEIVGWYELRWTIEQMFRVMKSQGLQLEDSQVSTAERLVKLAAVATKAACVDIQLTQGRDGTDQMPASNVFSEAEIDTLAALRPTLEGQTERQRNPHPPRSLAWAGWIIARLGGWNCYYKPPGPITFRRGMEHFYQIHRGRQLERLKREVRIP